jgi:hypothetical protein
MRLTSSISRMRSRPSNDRHHPQRLAGRRAGLKRVHDGSSAANDDIPPTRLDILVADAIENFVVRAERDIEEGEEPIEAAPALIELAAAAMTDVFLNAENSELTPELVIEMATGRMASMLMNALERSEVLHKPRLTVVEPIP